MLIKKMLKVIFLLSLFSSIVTQAQKTLNLNDDIGHNEPFTNFDSTSKLFTYKVMVASDMQFYILRTYDSNNEKSESPMHIFYHKDKIASPSNYQRRSAFYHANILALSHDIGREFFISVYCPGKCNGILTYYTSNYIHMNTNEHFEFIGGTNYTIAISPKTIYGQESVQVTLLGPQIPLDISYMKFGILQNESREMLIVEEDIPSRGVLINNCDLSYVLHPFSGKYVGAKYILIRIGGPEGQYMRFTTRHIGAGNYFVGDPAIYSMKTLEKDYKTEECIHILGAKMGERYQFRVITTTALQFHVNDGVFNETLGYMEDFQKDYSIKYDNEVTKFCFKSNSTTNRFGSIETTTKQGFYFQVVLAHQNTIKSILEPLYEGWAYKDKLNKGEMRYYRHAKWTPYKTNVLIRSRRGTLNAYQVKCPTFPYCDKFENYKNVSKLIYGFSAFVSTIEPKDESHRGDPTQVLHVVKCVEDTECLISIEYVDQLTNVVLRENENHAKFIEFDASEDYTIYPYTQHSQNKFEISLDIFAGDAVLLFVNDLKKYKYKYIFLGSSEKYIFEQDGFANGDKFQFSVNARKNTYYVLAYRQLKPQEPVIRIGESGLLLQAMKGDTSYRRNFEFWHNSPQKRGVPYVVNFIPLNCEIKAYSYNKELTTSREVKKNSIGHYEDILTNENREFSNISPTYYVNFERFPHKKPNDEYCLFFVGASESSKDLPTLLRENAAYSRTLNQLNKKAIFVWPFPFIKGDADITINLKNNVRLKSTVTINVNTKVSTDHFSRSTIIEIPYSHFTECQHIQGCPITLEIEFEDINQVPGGDYSIEVSLSTARKTPSLLQKGVMRRGGVNANTTDYYFFKVDKDEEGEIVVDFKRGTALLFAKMISQNEVNSNARAWQKKVVLPTKTDYDINLPYDPCRQKITYNSQLTSKCNEGCIIVFGVTTGDNFTQYQNLFTYEYYITARYIEKGLANLSKLSVSIPLNEFVIGSLSDVVANNYYDAYKLDIIESLQGIEVEFKSDSASMEIIWANDYSSKGCSLQGTSKLNLIKLIEGKDCAGGKIPRMRGTQFKFVISTKDLDKGTFSPYYFRVRPIYLENNRPHIIEVNADKETACEIKNGLCRLLVPLYSYDDISRFVVYADTEGRNDVRIYGKVIEAKGYDTCREYNCFTNFFPENSDPSSSYQENSKYFDFPGIDFQKKHYLTILIRSEAENQIIPVASSFKTYVESTYPTHNHLQLFYIRGGFSEKVILDDYSRNITAIPIFGKPQLQLKSGKQFKILNEVFNFNSKGKGDELTIKTSGNEHVIIGLKYRYFKHAESKITKIIIDNEYEKGNQIEANDKTVFEANVTVNSNRAYAIIRTYANSNSDSSMHILYSSTEVPTIRNYERASNLYQENILAVRTAHRKQFYITIVCPKKCSGTLRYYTSDYIHLDSNEHFEFIGGDFYNVAIKRSSVPESDRIQLILLGPQISLESKYMQIGVINQDGSYTTVDEPISGLLINGMELSAVINPNKDGYKNSKYVYVRLGGPKGHYMRFITRHINKGKYFIGDPAVYVLKDKMGDVNIFQDECIDILGGKPNTVYQFRLATTTSLNITINGNITRTVHYMRDYVTYYALSNNLNTSSLCFKSLNFTRRIRGEKEETYKQAFYFQIIIGSENTLDSVVEPLYEGWNYRDQLGYGETRYYRHAKWTNDKTNAIILSFFGTIQALQVKCITFPYCWSLENMRNVTKLIYSFGAFIGTIEPYEETHYGDSSQIVHLINCIDRRGCMFRFEYIDQKEIVRLRAWENHGKFIFGGDIERYIIDPYTNRTNYNKLELSLDIFAGDVSIVFQNNENEIIENEHVFYGNSEKYIFDLADLKDKIIYFNIVAKNNAYYVISYRHLDNKYGDIRRIGEGGTLFQVIKGEISKTHTFRFWHNSPFKPDVPYVVNFQTINCELSVTYISNTTRRQLVPDALGNYEDIFTLHKNPKEFNTRTLAYEVVFSKFKRLTPADNNCLFYAGASESSKEIPTLLRESTPYRRKLSKLHPNATFVWPFPYYKGDINLKVNLNNDKRLSILRTVNYNEMNTPTFSKTTMLEIDEGTLKENCLYSYGGCPIQVQVLLDKNITEYDDVEIEVSLTTRRKTPSMIPKGVLYRSGSNDNNVNYYYFEVDKGEEGEIVLDFKRGNGVMFAKMIAKKKDFSDNLEKLGSWRGKVYLPTEKNHDSDLVFNPITQKIRYNAVHTNKCERKCFIIFGVQTKDNMKVFQNIFNSEYNILIKYIEYGIDNLSKVSSFISINEMISGTLTDTSNYNYFDVYNLEVGENYNGLEIEFKSSLATIYISWEKDYRPVSTCYIGPKSEIQLKDIIKDEFCGDVMMPTNLKGKIFKFVVSTTKLEKGNIAQYYFRVRPIYSGRPRIIQLNSDKSTACKTNGNLCYFILPLSLYDQVSTIILYADTPFSQELTYYINVVPSQKYDSIKGDYNSYEQLLPTENSNKLSTREKYIILDNLNLTRKDYVLVTIKSEREQIISLYTSMKTYIHSTSPVPNHIQLAFISPGNKRNILIDRSVKMVYISTVKGKGVALFREKEYLLTRENRTILESKLTNATLNLTNNNTAENLLVAIKYLYEAPPETREITINEDLGKFEKIYSEYEAQFRFKVSVSTLRNYFILRTYLDNPLSGPIHIFMSIDQYPTTTSYHTGSYLYHENIIAFKKDFMKEFYVTVYCPEKCNGRLTYYTSNHIHMNTNDHFEFVGSSDFYDLVIKRENLGSERVQLVLLGPQIKLSSNDMEIGIMDETNRIQMTDQPVSGLLIRENELSYVIHPNEDKYRNQKYIYVRVHGPAGQFMRFMTRTIGNSRYYIGDPALYILKNKPQDIKQDDCVTFEGEVPGNIYQFRLVSTYPINMYINGKDTANVQYMKNYFKDYAIEQSGQKTTVCFRANDTMNINGKQELTSKIALYFQVINTDSNTMKTSLEPLYEGWKYTDNLKNGESRYYRHAKSSQYKTNVFIRSHKGSMNAFQVKCTSFPYCSEPENYKNVTKLIYAFSAFVSSIDPNDESHGGDPNQILHVVTCKNGDGCELSIRYETQSEYIYLRQNENHAKFMKAGDRESYMFTADLEKPNNRIELNLDVFSGDAVLNVYSELGEIDPNRYEHIFFGSSEKYILKQNDLKNKQIIFSVLARENSYYSVSFRELIPKEESSSLGENGLLLQFVNEKTFKSRLFQFFHNNPEKLNVPFIANFIPINCEIDVRFETGERQVRRNELGLHEDISTFSLYPETYREHLPTYSVKFKRFIGKVPPNQNCFFYVGAGESSFEQPTLLREDLPFVRTLNVINKRAAFVWPFPYKKGNAFIKINLKNGYKLSADIIVNNDTYVLSEIFAKSAIFEIPEKNLEQCSFNYGCQIMLVVQYVGNRNIENAAIPIEVMLTTGRETPQMLPKNEIRRGGFNDNSTNYYYIDIVKGEEGEIILDFKRGSGLMFAKIINHEFITENPRSWRERVVLPTEKDHDSELAFNYATQKIIFKKELTNTCGNLCFIVVGVSSKYKFDGVETNFASEYSILVRDIIKGSSHLKDTAVNITVNEYISGALQYKENYYESYLLNFLDDYRGFEIEFKSTKAKLSLSFGKPDHRSDCIVEPSPSIRINKYYDVMKVVRCGSVTIPHNLYQKKLYIVVSTDSFEKGNFTSYFFRVRPRLKDRTHIIEINSDKETVCKAEQNSLCHFLVPLYSWDGVSNIILYANTGKQREFQEERDVAFYYKIVSADEYESCNGDSCSSFIARDVDHNTENQDNSKYLIIKGYNLYRSDYIMISIKSYKDQLVPIISSTKNFYSHIMPRPNYGQLVYMYAKEKRRVQLNEYISQVNVNYILGYGEISINLFKYELPSNAPIKALTYKSKSNIIVENKVEGHFLILLEYSYDKKPNISKIEVTERKGENKFFIAESPEMFHYEVEVRSSRSYAIFRTYSGIDNLGPMHIFMHDKEIPSPALYNISSSLHHENVLAVKTSGGKNRRFYISVACPEKCKGNLTYYSSDYIHMNNNDHFEFIGGQFYILAFQKSSVDKNEAVQLVLLGPQMSLNTEFLQIGTLDESTNMITVTDTPNKGLLINDMELSSVIHPSNDKYKGKYIFVRVGGPEGHFMRFMSRHIGQGKYYIDEPAVYSLKAVNTEIFNKECVEVFGGKPGEIYEFKLITTYSIDFTIEVGGDLRNEFKNVEYMSDTSTSLTVPSADKRPKVCFVSSKNTKKGTIEERTQKQALFFQINRRERNLEVIYEPLYEGWGYKYHLPYGQWRYFRHAKWTPQNTNVYIISNNGNLNVHQVRCTTFPYCYDSSSYENVTKLIYAFGAFVSTINHKEESHYGDSKQVIHLVNCLSKGGCDIKIEYYDLYNEIRFKENENHAKFLEKGGTETYEFMPLPTNDNNIIELNLDVFSGDAVINFASDKLGNIKYEHVFFGNSEKYIFKATDVKRKLIKFWVRAKENSFYVVSFRDVEKKGETSSIGESGFLLQAIEGDKQLERFFGFWHNTPGKQNTPYVTNFMPINCQIELSLNNTRLKHNSINHFEEIHTSGVKGFESHTLAYLVKFGKFTQSEPDNKKYCYFYVGSSESSQYVPTVIRESMSYTRTLTEKARNAVFVLPFAFTSGDLDIKLNLRNSYKIKANVTVNNELVAEQTFTRSALLEVSESNLFSCEYIVGCAVTISVELAHIYELNDTKVPIEILVSTNRRMPTVLQKGVLRRTAINGNTTDYYYIEIGKGEEGEIILDFKRGTGIMFAKMVDKKRHSEHEDAWRQKVILPDEQVYDISLPFNHITQKIKYEKKHTQSCVNGCFLVLGVKSKESYGGYETIFTSEYSIFARYLKPGISYFSQVAVNIPLNEYIIGSLESETSAKQFDAFVIDILDDYKDLEIEFNSQNAKLYYTFQQDFLHEGNSNLISPGKQVQIKKITDYSNVSSFKGKKLLITVGSDKLGKGKTARYTFKVRPVYKNRTHLIELNTDKPTVCEAKENDICNFYLPLSTYDGISDLVVYADAPKEVVLYTTITSSDYFSNCDFEKCLKDVLPSKNRFVSTSENQVKKNYLLLSPSQYSKNDIILFAVTTREKQDIPIVTSFKSYVNTTIPTPNNLQIIDINPGAKQRIIMNQFVKNMKVTLVQGKGKIQYDKEYNFNADTKPTQIFVVEKKKNLTIYNNDPQNNLILAFRYDINEENINPPRPDRPADIPDGKRGDKDKNKDKKKRGISGFAAFVIFIIIVALIICGVYKYLQSKKEQDVFKKAVDQLSITLSGNVNGNDVESQKIPLLDDQPQNDQPQQNTEKTSEEVKNPEKESSEANVLNP